MDICPFCLSVFWIANLEKKIWFANPTDKRMQFVKFLIQNFVGGDDLVLLRLVPLLFLIIVFKF